MSLRLAIGTTEMDETVRIMCPSLTCRRVLGVPSAARGKTVRCRNCGTNIKIPAAGENPLESKKPPEAKKPADPKKPGDSKKNAA
ncbi:MAG: hypothetical protein LW822_05555 [Phycisphaeraceae bacterium]|nr:hypothetical protein [Phycisphaeraceae bacterium]